MTERLENILSPSQKRRCEGGLGILLASTFAAASLSSQVANAQSQPSLNVGLTWDASSDAHLYSNFVYRVIVRKNNGPESIAKFVNGKNWTNGVSKVRINGLEPNSLYVFSLDAVAVGAGANGEDLISDPSRESVSYATGAINLEDTKPPELLLYSMLTNPEGEVELQGSVNDESHISGLDISGILRVKRLDYSPRGGIWTAKCLHTNDPSGRITITAYDVRGHTNRLFVTESSMTLDSDGDGVPDITERNKYRTNPNGIDDSMPPLISFNNYSTNSLDGLLEVSGEVSDEYPIKSFAISGEGFAPRLNYPTNQISGKWSASIYVTNQGLSTLYAEAVDIFNNVQRISFVARTDDPNIDSDGDGVSDFREMYEFNTNPHIHEDTTAPVIIVDSYPDVIIPSYFEEDHVTLSGRITDESPIKSYRVAAGAYQDYPQDFEGRTFSKDERWHMDFYLEKAGVTNIVTLEAVDIFNNTNRINLPIYVEDIRKDSDGDGVPDYFEKTTSNTDFMNADSDGDGINDGDEMAAGYNPRDAGSRPYIERAWMDSQGFNIFFRSNLQAVYTVQRTIDGGINWEDVGEPVFGEMESTVIDSNIYRNAAYRLKVQGTEFLDFYNY